MLTLRLIYCNTVFGGAGLLRLLLINIDVDEPAPTEPLSMQILLLRLSAILSARNTRLDTNNLRVIHQ
jgi:hypothetical protein